MAQDRAPRPTAGNDVLAESPSASSPSSLGQQPSTGGTYFLGRYRVVDEIGIGGMASVHLARMDGPGGFQKWVAIKRIHPHLVEDDSFVHMFLDEARVAARISHPNVATVFELGKHEDTYWIAMEYLHGEPLREVMRRTEELGQPMPPEIACRVIADAAEGLHAAHELLGKNGEKLGLVHRDVTPHNLFVTYDGNTKVVDFGIAKFSSRMATTRAGTLKGKLAYMSPEQVQGEAIDRRTDIFALGVVLWELTTGQRLFRMENDLDTLAKVQECNVARPSSIVRGYPIDLEKIVMKALAKNKNERFRTARELSRALQSLLMRRGLFVASDEVAAYTRSIFSDRIRKREAHLRWAAEVTQTLSLEGHKPSQGSDGWTGGERARTSESSEVQPSVSLGRAPRPAAGAPVSVLPNLPPAPLMSAPPSSMASGAKPRPGPSIDTLRPPPRPGPAGLPALKGSPPLASDHPALDELATMRSGAARPPPEPAAPPAPPASNNEAYDFDDTDDTIVQAPRLDELNVAPGLMGAPLGPMPTPLPAAGRPPPSPALGGGAAYGGPGASQRPPAPRPATQIPTVPPTARPAFPPPAAPFGAAPPPPTVKPVDASSLSAGSEAKRIERLFDGLGGPLQPFAPGAPTVPRSIPTSSVAADARTRVLARAMFHKDKLRTWMLAGAAVALGLILIGLLFAMVGESGQSAPAKASNLAAKPTGPFSAARAAFATATAATAAAAVPTARGSGGTPNASAGATPPAASPGATAAPAPPRAVVHEARAVAAPWRAPASTGRAPARDTADRRPPASEAGEPGFMTVVCMPACDQIIDNGKPLGASPIFKRPVAVGEHRLKLVRRGPPVTKVVSVIVTSGTEATPVRQSMIP